MSTPDDIKSNLPPNIKVGGKIINTGSMNIDGKEMPTVPEADIVDDEIDQLTPLEVLRKFRYYKLNEVQAEAAIQQLVRRARLEELKTCLSTVPMPALSYEQVENRIKQLESRR